ncbi:CCA tRNA nucleotidyltransferase [Paracoccus liaowanqingii]|uniref:CCA tRNA nucleotidyltransferase n=1 Tax=Paracoccus liaowanqingii TaxID=2560053 RepID=A0A4P7HKQ8_9RHOB|nr:CCA tRNA nucleotidyltransferase [Paracoccus liaowanqingii]QBX33671.1 CCA tRNA nucleotidyltransferase [Paracoccus liaowanqingii]
MTQLPPQILQDPALQRVLDALQAQGDGAWLVGGVVRNALLGEPVDDIDIATDATPDRVQALAHAAGLRAVPTGIDHGTVTLVADGRGFEVTTFRRDVETDGRHATVAFSTDLAEDAARRDFTMNALYADASGQVIDPVGGLPDLAARHLRFVGDPNARIAEDYLRLLRFFRFFARYGRQADPAAVAACAAHRDGLARIARERIGAETKKLLAAPDPGPAVALMAQTGVLDLVLPGADPAALDALLAAEPAPGGWLRRLAALCPTGPAPDLRLSRAEARALSALHQASAKGWSLDEAAFRLSPEAAADHAVLRAAQGHSLPPDLSARIAAATEIPMPIAAADLAPLEGPALGRALKAAEAAWIASGFTLPAPALIDAAGLAEEDPT